MSDLPNQSRGALPEQHETASGLELVGEVSDLAVGVGMLVFTLAPFALPLLALLALAAVPLLIAMLLAGMLVAPVLAARRWWRSRDRASGARAPSAPAMAMHNSAAPKRADRSAGRPIPGRAVDSR